VLFDLRGKRKRMVQGTYVFLAILFAFGLVGFGVGGNVHGGLIDALSSDARGHGGSNTQEDVVERFEDRVAARPTDARAWAQLARAEYAVASSSENFDRDEGTLSERGREIMARAVIAWEQYLALGPRRPDAGAAALMVNAYVALSRFDRAADAQRLVVVERASANTWFQYAVLSYASDRPIVGDGAARRAVRRTPEAQRVQVRSLLRQAKRLGPAAVSALAPASSGAAPSHGG